MVQIYYHYLYRRIIQVLTRPTHKSRPHAGQPTRRTPRLFTERNKTPRANTYRSDDVIFFRDYTALPKIALVEPISKLSEISTYKTWFLMFFFLLFLSLVTAAGGIPLGCTSAADQPQWPTYHAFNNVTKGADGAWCDIINMWSSLNSIFASHLSPFFIPMH